MEDRISHLHSRMWVVGYILAAIALGRIGWRYFHEMEMFPGIWATVGAERLFLIVIAPYFLTLYVLSTLRIAFMLKR